MRRKHFSRFKRIPKLITQTRLISFLRCVQVQAETGHYFLCHIIDCDNDLGFSPHNKVTETISGEFSTLYKFTVHSGEAPTTTAAHLCLPTSGSDALKLLQGVLYSL